MRAYETTCSAARKQKKTCKASGFGTTQYNGKAISLREKAGRVSVLCDRLRKTENLVFSADAYLCAFALTDLLVRASPCCTGR